MPRISVVLFLLSTLLWLGMTGQPSSANNILQKCSGVKSSGSVMAGRSTILHVFEKPMRSLSLDCFFGEVYSVKGGQDHRDENNYTCFNDIEWGFFYRLIVQASYTDEHGVEHTLDFPIHNASTGSLAQTVYRLPAPSTFSIRFINAEVEDYCTLGIDFSFDYTEEPSIEDEVNLPIPVLLYVWPVIAYTQKEDKTTFVFQFPKNVSEEYAVSSLVKLVSYEDSCYETSSANYIDSNVKIPRAFTPLNPWESHYARAYQFKTPGSYRICFQANKSAISHELGIVTVFNGNPGYFELYTDEHDENYKQDPIYIKFFGSLLDTRVGGDVAKIVSDYDSCESNIVPDGVLYSSRLLPIDKHGLYSTFAIWSVVIANPGFYKACYKRRGEEWAEVPSHVLAWSMFGPMKNSTPAVFPIPVDPVTNEACPTAPTDGSPWAAYTSLQFNMKKSVQIEAFIEMITNLFCVPRSAFAIIRMLHDKDGKQIVHITFTCKGVMLHDGRAACDSIERSNYAVILSQMDSTLLHENEIDQILGSTSIAIPGDDPEFSGHTRSIWIVVIICATVVACIGILVFGVLKYRQRRQCFVQFGMDDDSVDNMYASGMAPTGTGGSTQPDLIQQPTHYHHATSGGKDSIKVVS